MISFSRSEGLTEFHTPCDLTLGLMMLCLSKRRYPIEVGFLIIVIAGLMIVWTLVGDEYLVCGPSAFNICVSILTGKY